jgi:hypothetical protein
VRAVPTTEYPARRKPAARPAPMPCEAPVIIATLGAFAVALIRRGTDASAYCSRAGIGSASAARPGGAGKESAKYCVSCVTKPSLISMTLSEYVGTPS